jgi:pilus assembly protein Flp/PilA
MALMFSLNRMKARLTNFFRDRLGATAIEYALIASIVSIVIITAAALLGSNMAQSYNTTSNKVGNALK